MVKVNVQIADLAKRIAAAEQWVLELEQLMAERLRNGSNALKRAGAAQE